MDFTQTWHWPQWAMVVLLLVGFMITAMDHGKPKVETIGPDKGQVQKYNAFVSLTRAFVLVFILICGGFFS